MAALADGVPMEQLQRETLEMAQGFFSMASGTLFVGLGLFILAGLLVLTVAVAPDMTRRNGQTFGEKYLASFFAGVPIVGLLILGLFAAKSVPPVAIAVVVVGFFLGTLGLAATCETLGRRVFWTANKMGNRPLHVVVGALVLSFSSMIPIAGWLMGAYAIVAGLGAVVLGIFRKAPPREPPPIQTFRSAM